MSLSIESAGSSFIPKHSNFTRVEYLFIPFEETSSMFELYENVNLLAHFFLHSNRISRNAKPPGQNYSEILALTSPASLMVYRLDTTPFELLTFEK